MMTTYNQAHAELVGVSDLRVGDQIVDPDGLLQVIKAITPKGQTHLAITTNYVESGFYRADDTTHIVRRTLKAWRSKLT